MEKSDLLSCVALAAARERGASHVKEEFNASENLTLDAASQLSGRSTYCICEAQRLGRLYALFLNDQKPCFRYPMWQFEVLPERLTTILDMFEQSESSCWVMHSFLMRRNISLSDISPAEYLKRIDLALIHLIDTISMWSNIHQGGS